MGKTTAICVLVICPSGPVLAEKWGGLRVEPENRCNQYNRKGYPYPQSVELEIIERDGLVNRYTGKELTSRFASDIEHIVALSEAHDSGLWGADSKRGGNSRPT